MPTAPNDGIVDLRSHHSVADTVAKLEATLKSKGVTLFALVDHSGEAAKVGLTMPPTKLLIFGRPEAGTPAMLAAPRLALDLPLKILVWEDADRNVWVTHASTGYLQARHGLGEAHLRPLAVIESLAAAAAAD
jgi:uncharacterized protein (DUF302 family)